MQLINLTKYIYYAIRECDTKSLCLIQVFLFFYNRLFIHMYLNRPEPKRRWVIHNRTKDLLSDGPSLQTITEIKDINAKISYDPKTSVHTAPNLYMQPSFDFYIPPKERKEPKGTTTHQLTLFLCLTVHQSCSSSVPG